MKALTPSREDYLKTIWVTGLGKKVVRVKNLAEELDVKPASVVGVLKTLQHQGLIEHEHYGYIELTEEGEAIAKEIYEKEKTLFRFFHEMLRLPAEIAEQDACAIEHHISPEGVERMLAFINFVKECPEGEPLWFISFQYYIKTGHRPEQISIDGKMD